MAAAPTSCGLASRRAAVAAVDAACVAKLRAAGAVVLGKTNLDGSAGCSRPTRTMAPRQSLACRAQRRRLLRRRRGGGGGGPARGGGRLRFPGFGAHPGQLVQCAALKPTHGEISRAAWCPPRGAWTMVSLIARRGRPHGAAAGAGRLRCRGPALAQASRRAGTAGTRPAAACCQPAPARLRSGGDWRVRERPGHPAARARRAAHRGLLPTTRWSVHVVPGFFLMEAEMLYTLCRGSRRRCTVAAAARPARLGAAGPPPTMLLPTVCSMPPYSRRGASSPRWMCWSLPPRRTGLRLPGRASRPTPRSSPPSPILPAAPR